MVFDVPKIREAFAGRGSTVTQEVALHVGLSIAALGIDSFNLLGSSFGANVALQLAIHQPERVRALILASPTAIRPEPTVTGTPPAQAVDGSARQSLEQQLAALEIPVLVLFGTEDLVVPPESGRIYREKLPNCHYVLVYGAGHAIEDDRPEAFVSVVSDFVDGPDGFIVNQRSGLINP
jgi:pimeloyl-ACP methyl ester carboxylesterase